MSGHGAPTQIQLNASALRVAVIAAKWHHQVMDGLLAGAQRALTEAGVAPANTAIVRVPGTFELPVAAARLAVNGSSAAAPAPIQPFDFGDILPSIARQASAQRFDAIVALGVVIRGGTPHFEYVCEAATQGLTQVSVQTGIPVGFGVLTCDNDQQALDRAGLPGSAEDKGYEATMAALETALTLRQLGA